MDTAGKDGRRIRHREMLTWTPEMVQNFWDYYAQFPEAYFGNIYGPRIVKHFRPFLAECDTILDYGCGTGDLLDNLLAAGYRCAGVDFSPETISRVEKRFDGREGFIGASTREDALRAGQRFDGAFVLEVIEHLYDPDLDNLLETVRKLVRPGGLIMITTPNEEDIEAAAILCPVSNTMYHPYQHVRSWSKDSLSQALQQRGFDVVSCEAIHFKSVFAPKTLGSSAAEFVAAARTRWRYVRKPHKIRPHLTVVVRSPSPPNEGPGADDA